VTVVAADRVNSGERCRCPCLKIESFDLVTLLHSGSFLHATGSDCGYGDGDRAQALMVGVAVYGVCGRHGRAWCS
jgi:hypothetical protein